MYIENPCPPSALGINHYVTSERFLNDNIAAYPAYLFASNGTHSYVDREVVRAVPERKKLVMQAWKRYYLPIGATEVHLGDCVDEQKRWLGEAWQQAKAVIREGADVLAVTAWALLNLYD